MADKNSDIKEGDEANNATAVEITVTAPPDLIISDQSLSQTTVAPGNIITANVTVKNSGAGSADTSWVGYFYSPDSACGIAGDILLTYDAVESLAADTTAAADNALITIPSQAEAGTGYICFMADKNSDIKEGDEANNTAAVEITVTAN